jgi:hypothetical protein
MIQTKNKAVGLIGALLGLLMAMTSLSYAQQISSVSVKPDPTCPPKITVTINADKDGTVSYQIEYQTAGASGYTSGSTGTLPVTAGEHEYKLDLSWPGSCDFRGDVRVTITGANKVTSTEATINVNCCSGSGGPGGGGTDPPLEEALIATSQAIQTTSQAILFGVVVTSTSLAIAVIGGLILAFSLARELRRKSNHNPQREQSQAVRRDNA